MTAPSFPIRAFSEVGEAASWVHLGFLVQPNDQLDIRFLQSPDQRNPSPPPLLPSNIPQLVNMLRQGAVRALFAVTRTQIPRQVSACRPRLSQSLLQSSRVAPSFAVQSIRCYSAPAGLSKDEVQGRIMDLLANFDKVCIHHSVTEHAANFLQVTDASKVHETIWMARNNF